MSSDTYIAVITFLAIAVVVLGGALLDVRSQRNYAQQRWQNYQAKWDRTWKLRFIVSGQASKLKKVTHDRDRYKKRVEHLQHLLRSKS